MTRPARTASLFFLGSFLIQIAWIAALPPFRGIDEFDHAYRAAAVAEGQWRPDYVPARHGRGDLVVVPRSMVDAATSVCESYDYTGHDNCHPVASVGNGKVTVASAAARYNPVFYWMIGKPASFFQGATSLYVMRTAGALLCSLLVALAAWILATWSTTRWPLVGLAVTLTPMVTYSTSLGAPNGIEMVGGVALWAALVGLFRTEDQQLQRKLLYASVPGAVAVAGVRALGPLWMVMIVLTCVLLLGRGKMSALLRTHRRVLGTVGLTITLATASAAWWSLANRATSEVMVGHHHLPHPVLKSLSFTPLWILQSIAAFPTRDERAPTLVYAAALIALLLFLSLATRNASTRLRTVIALATVAALGVSFCASALTYSRIGQAWQGRYALPYLIGVPILAGLALELRPFRHRLRGPFLFIGWVLLAIAQAVSIGTVLTHELLTSPPVRHRRVAGATAVASARSGIHRVPGLGSSLPGRPASFAPIAAP